MIDIDYELSAADFSRTLAYFFERAVATTQLLRRRWDPNRGAPVFTEAGQYTARGWTEWTQGFQFGNALYLFEATGNEELLEYGRRATREYMAPHITHIGVHDHGFNNVSTYGNLLRLMRAGRIPENERERDFYVLALKLSGAVQAARWTDITEGLGFVHSFNGPHSLFSDTIRSMRALAVAHQSGHVLMGEQDRRISLLERLLQHAEATARYNVYFGEGRDSYDLRGRVVHESIFNTTNGVYRCPSTQQGYSPFTTWTRGLSWILAGYPEELDFLETLSDEDIATPESPYAGLAEAKERFTEVARAVADFFIEQTPTDGVPYWDTGAPGLAKLGDYLSRPADPFNAHEPVDSSAAAISAQGLIRLGLRLLGMDGVSGKRGSANTGSNSEEDREAGKRYLQAGLTVARTVLSPPYLCEDDGHEGILLHCVYHQPNGWDYVPKGTSVPNGESCMWGDYHAVELAVMLKHLAETGEPHVFFDI